MVPRDEFHQRCSEECEGIQIRSDQHDMDSGGNPGDHGAAPARPPLGQTSEGKPFIFLGTLIERSTRKIASNFWSASKAIGEMVVGFWLRAFEAMSAIIQALLGHDKLETTARYTRVATRMITKVTSP